MKCRFSRDGVCTLTQAEFRNSLICDGEEEARLTCPLWFGELQSKK